MELATEFLNQAALQFTLTVIDNGESAIDILVDNEAGRPPPDLILLDLNLPKRSGFEVLAELKAKDSTKSTPVVILTSSGSGRDIMRAYEAQANAFVRKPRSLDGWEDFAQSLKDFFFGVALLPSSFHPRTEP